MSRPINIAFLTHYAELYGANRSLLQLIDGLGEYPVTPHVILPESGDICEILSAQGITFSVIPMQCWAAPKVRPNNLNQALYQQIRQTYHAIRRLSLNLWYQPQLVQQLKDWKIDVVHTNSAILPSGALAAQRLGLPHIWHLREFLNLDYNLHHDWGKSLHDTVIQRANAKIAISQAIRQHYAGSSAADSFHLIYNGATSSAEFERLKTLGSQPRDSSQAYTFAIVGNLNAAKGQGDAIAALAEVIQVYPRTKLLIVGNGSPEDFSRLRQQAAQLNITDNIEFWGFVEDPYKAYLAADAVLMCSKNEGMGRVTVEAMATLRPVIGFDNAGTAEIIDHNQTGLLYRGGPEQLARHMCDLIKNKELGPQLAQRAWTMARQRYSTEAYASQIYGVVSSLIEQQSHRHASSAVQPSS